MFSGLSEYEDFAENFDWEGMSDGKAVSLGFQMTQLFSQRLNFGVEFLDSDFFSFGDVGGYLVHHLAGM